MLINATWSRQCDDQVPTTWSRQMLEAGDGPLQVCVSVCLCQCVCVVCKMCSSVFVFVRLICRGTGFSMTSAGHEQPNQVLQVITLFIPIRPLLLPCRCEIISLLMQPCISLLTQSYNFVLDFNFTACHSFQADAHSQVDHLLLK